MSLLVFFNQAEEFAYKIDLVTGGVVVIGVVTGDRSFICRFILLYDILLYCSDSRFSYVVVYSWYDGKNIGFVCMKLWVRISMSSNVCH